MEDTLAYIFKLKLRLQLDRKRWLGIIEMFYKQYNESKDPEHKKKIKEMMVFCGEQSQQIKNKLATLK